MMTQSQFDSLEYQHYWNMFDEYNKEIPYDEEEEEEEKSYLVTWSYKGCRNEFFRSFKAWDAEEAEHYFWLAVKNGRIERGIPQNLDDIEILEIWEAS